MRRLFSLLSLAVVLLAVSAHAQNPLGTVSATYSYNASKVLADPIRNRVYVTDTVSNSVVVIDTTTLKATATVLVGSDPVDMSVSPDGNTLYVANGGSNLAAIAVLDLNTLAVRATFPLTNPPVAIAAGLANRVYVAASPDNFSSAIYQLDGTTGAVQTTFNSGYYDNNLFALSPDGKTLYEANNQDEPGDLKSFDVSTATPTVLQDNERISTFPPELVVSHHGKYLCLPSYSSATYLYSTADITAYYGSFTSKEGYGSGPLAFSPDDSLVYQVNDDGGALDVFSTTTFTEVNGVTLSTNNGSGYPGTVRQVVADRTGSYLFIGTTTNNGTTTTGQLSVLATGAGTLSAPSIAPVISGNLAATATQKTAFSYQITASNQPTHYAADNLPYGLELDSTTGLISGAPVEAGTFVVALQATNLAGTSEATLTLAVAASVPSVTLTANLPTAYTGGDDVGEFTVSLSDAQDHDVMVNFTVKGSAVNGTDYALFKGTKKIKAGQTSKPIKIIPQGDLEGAAKKVVTLSLAPGDGYTVGTTGKVKVRIYAPVE